MPEKVAILTHHDVDGVCSAALAKIVHPDAEVDFAEPYDLASKLLTLPARCTIVLELGINAAQKELVKKAFKKMSGTYLAF